MIFNNQVLNNVQYLNKLVLMAQDKDAENNIIDICDSIVDASSESIGLKKYLVNLEVQIDRWDLRGTDIIFHIDLYEYIIDKLNKDLNKENNNFYLWGMQLHFLKDFISDTILLLDRNLEDLDIIKTRYILLVK